MDIVTEKKCRLCEEMKGIDNFSVRRDAKDGRRNECKTCGYSRINHWHAENSEKRREYAKKHYALHPNARKRNRLIREYGITLEDYEVMLFEQEGKCAICQSVMEKPHIDHNHSTGAVRGLLCFRCNSAIGNLRENPEILRSALEYLENDAVRKTVGPLEIS